MKKLIRLLWKLFFLGIVLFFLVLLLINWGVIGYMPPMETLENPSASLATEIYANDNSLMGKFYYADQNRTAIDFKEISPNVIHALIATEDQRFYKHSGIDPVGTLAIPFYLLTGRKRGSSTITQQLALNLFGVRARNPVKRAFQKLNEWVLAIKLERNFTKDEILALYLNTVGFGDNVKGIKNAALTFFGKNPSDLNVEEAATLVGMLKGNTLYNPRVNPERSLVRRNTVISRMEKTDYLTKEESEKAKSEPIELNYHKTDQNTGVAPYAREYIRGFLKNWAQTHKKSDGSNYNIYSDGLRIYTTIEPELQRYAEEAVNEHLATLQKSFDAQYNIKNGAVWKQHQSYLNRFIKESARYKNMKDAGMKEADIMKFFETKKVLMPMFSWKAKPDNAAAPHTIQQEMTPLDSIKHLQETIQAGFLAMDPETGGIKAWVGGPDFRYFKNDHIFTRRQVGSTIKPFLYTLAVMNGFTPNTEVPNEPITFPEFNNWSPKNDGGTSGGMVTLSQGLAHSLNLVAAYLVKQLTPKVFANFLKNNIGFTSDVPPYPSIALGTPEISLYEMVRGYSIFPNKGLMTSPLLITRIEDRNGNILANFTPQMHEVINATIASTMVRMMENVVNNGTASRLRWMFGLQNELAGKTGTTNDNTDGWFLGYTPQLIAGAWVGFNYNFLHFNSTSIGQGANTGLPIFGQFLKKVYAHSETTGIHPDAKFELIAPPIQENPSLKTNDPLPPGRESSPQKRNSDASDYMDVGNSDESGPKADYEEEKDSKSTSKLRAIYTAPSEE